MVTEIVLPETTPESEWINGRAVQKVMPTTDHGIIQAAFLRVLQDWAAAEAHGIALPEWRFRVSREGIPIHPLVPDVAYMSFSRLRSLPKADRQAPTLPPEIVVEVRSPTDEPKDIESKREDFLAWGASLDVLADPAKRGSHFYDSDGGVEYVDWSVEVYTHPVFPDLRFPMRWIFEQLDIFGD